MVDCYLLMFQLYYYISWVIVFFKILLALNDKKNKTDAILTTLRISCVHANFDSKTKCITEIEKLKNGMEGRGTSA